MKEERVIVIHADTWEELTLKMMGYYHDHCWHYYSGLTSELPDKFRNFIAEDKKYIFLCEEDEPYVPDFKFQKDYFLGTPHTNKETKIDTLDYDNE